jgi:hypothetical protein
LLSFGFIFYALLNLCSLMSLNITRILSLRDRLSGLLASLIADIADLIPGIKIQYLIILASDNLLLYNLMFFMSLMTNLQYSL